MEFPYYYFIMWTARRIAKALSQTYLKDDFPIHNIHFDTRLIGPHDCFIALDKGHDYLGNKDLPFTIGEKNADIIVNDSQQALFDLGIYARDNSPAKRIAVTGSVGKTTTKTFLNQVLSQMFKTIASDKSFNNHIGTPLTLTKLTPETEIGVFEVGSNNPGEISMLSHLVQPDIAIITNISEAHIGQFPNGLQGIIDEKTSILHGLKKGGIIIIPESIKPLIHHENVRILDESKLQSLNIPIIQEHHRKNILPVLEVLDILNVPYHNIDFSKLTLPKGRGGIHHIKINQKNITLIDDAYNAPFLGMQAALYELSKHKGRKVAVLADMGELGDHAYALHQQLVDLTKTLKIDIVLPCGKIFAELLQQPIFHKEDVISVLENNDVVLFKGSNSSNLHQTVHRILEQAVSELKN